MKMITKLSIALLLGAFISACSETADKQAIGVSAPAKEQLVDSHEGHAHNEPAKLTEAAIATAGELYQQDVHYRVLETPFTAENNQVNEFFWYGCPACKATEPLMKKLKANDKLAVEVNGSLLNENWVFDAFIFEAFKHFEVLETAHPAYFEARQNGSVSDQISFENFLLEQGLDTAEFEAFTQSDAMKEAVNASYEIESRLHSTGVPTLAVAGKYVILNRGFSDINDMQKAIEWLTQK